MARTLEVRWLARDETEDTMRSMLYKLARIMGDVNAVKRGRVGRRIARRAAGRATGRGLGRIFK